MPMHLSTLQAALKAAPPEFAVVLGSGLGRVAEAAEHLQHWPFTELPLPAAPTVAGHRGRLSHVRWSGRAGLVFEGRLHFYEGHTWDEVAAPVRLAADLGVKILVLTNAAGGIRSDLNPGSLMVLQHHLKLNRPGFWRHGMNSSSPIYTLELNDLLLRAAHEENVDLKQGIYGSVTGPTYETPAEIRAFQAMGIDAIGMSTTHEAETAARLGLGVVAISCITNKGAGLADVAPHHAEVLLESQRAADRLSLLLARFLRLLPDYA